MLEIRRQHMSSREAPQADAIELARLPSPSRGLEEPAKPVGQHAGRQQQQQQPAATPAYAFLHAFEGQGAEGAVGAVKWAPGSADRLAWGGAGGAVYLATTAAPPRLLQVLESHRDRVADLAWSSDGAALLSCSRDGTACLWRAEEGTLVRTLRNATGPLGCCAFHPANRNLLLLGTAAGELLVLNASTGLVVARAELQQAPMAGVGACCLELVGASRLLAADSRGCLHLYSAKLHGGRLHALEQLAYFTPPGSRRPAYHEPASLQYLPHTPLAGGPAVLLALSSGEVVLSRLCDKPWRLEVLREMQTEQASAKVRAALRPSAGAPELVLTGGEDCRVHLTDLSSSGGEPPRLLAALAAHKAPVLGVAWSADERRIASCDRRGTVVVWQRREAPAKPPTPAHARARSM